jgi:hypothetical protein
MSRFAFATPWLTLALALLCSGNTLCLAHPEELVDSLMDRQERRRAMPREADRFGEPLWEIDARVPFIGSPVHEQMTIASINASGVHRRTYRLDYDDAYIHGVFWNDDPEDLLCPECNGWNLRRFEKRWGLAFATRFDAAKKAARPAEGKTPAFFTVGSGLLERSHFGDLQFLHGMAARDGEAAAVTQDRILQWAELAYRVAIGDIPHSLRMDQIPIAEVRALFAGDPALEGRTLEQLFKGKQRVKRVMIGSLLHIVQDSYAPGHAERDVQDFTDGAGAKVFSRGRIKRFHAYANQDPKLHAEDDRWPPGLASSGAADRDDNPISVGARILRYVYANEGDGAPWPEVRSYLRDVVFAVTDPAAEADPGEKYCYR